MTGQATVGSATATLTATWQRFSYTGTVPTNSTQIAIAYQPSPTGTAGTNDYFEVTGVQIDIGSVALPYRAYAATFQGELAACQRYYYLHASGSTQPIAMASSYSTTLSIAMLQLPVTMRIAPTIAATTGTNYYGMDIAGTAAATNALSIGQASTTAVRVDGTYTGLVVGQAGYLRTNNASASLAFTSEL
jgi:hypothetical protein